MDTLPDSNLPGVNDATAAPIPPVRVTDVVKRFDTKTVLDGISLQVLQGQTLVVMGASGCGKSTLLRTMIGSIRPEQGRVEILGQDIAQPDEDALNAVRKKIGVLFQSGALFNSMTLRENVALPLQEHTNLAPEMIDIMVKIKLELVGLREHADKFPAQISGGMKKRAGLARALSMDPQILFYDEPSAGLDPVTSAEIDQLIIALSKRLGVTSVVVTHEMDSAFVIADRIAMMDQGKMLAIEDRSWFEALRDSITPTDQLPQEKALIRQFLRGEAQGPITQRKQASNYEDDLLGLSVAPPASVPALQCTRRRSKQIPMKVSRP